VLFGYKINFGIFYEISDYSRIFKENCMKKRFSLLIGGLLVAASLLFMACPTEPEDTTATYSVITEVYVRASTEATLNPEAGTVTATPRKGSKGTPVTVAIASAEQYYLDEVIQDETSKGKSNPLSFLFVDKDVTIKAYFKALPANTYKVILKQPEKGGTISFDIDGASGNEFASAGSTVKLSNSPAEGYIFKSYTVDDVADITDPSYSFPLPAKHVTVSGVFEELKNKNIDELLTAGRDALQSGNLTVAINAYEAAYSKDPDNTEALVYSTAGKLASIAWSKDVGNFFKNRLGLKYYPNTLDALINPKSWTEYYPEKDTAEYYYDSTRGETLEWREKSWYDYPGGTEYFEKHFKSGDGYYYQGPYKFVSSEKRYSGPDSTYFYWSYQDEAGNEIHWYERENFSWDYSWFDKYRPNGSGYYYGDPTYIFVDAVPRHNYASNIPLNVPGWLTEKGAYTDSLVTIGEEAVASSSTWPLILIANLIDRNTTGLNPALDDAISAIFDNSNYKEAVSRTAKLKDKEPVKFNAASFGLSEFFGGEEAYVGWAELELVLSALKLVKGTLHYVNSYNWSYDVGFVKDLPWDKSALDQIESIAGNRNKVLPLRTKFMTDRGGNHLANSKTAYVEALDSIIGVYDYYTGDSSKLPAVYKNKLKEYASYKTSVEGARDAIKNGTAFTVPAALLGDQNLTIDFGKFFTPGQIALDKLLETEGSGSTKSPVFYGFTWDNSGNISFGEKITSLGGFQNYSTFGFKLTTTPIREIVGGNFAEELLATEYLPVLDPMSATIAWAVYHWDEGGKDLFGSFSEEDYGPNSGGDYDPPNEEDAASDR
jgi:hypothetical protein